MNNAAESRNQSNKEEVMNKWDPEKLQEFIENIETVKVIDLENKLSSAVAAFLVGGLKCQT